MSDVLEFHDTDLSGHKNISANCTELILDPAMIHVKKEPLASNEIWTQALVLRLGGVQKEQGIPPIPAWIYDGFIEIDGKLFSNVISVPYFTSGGYKLHMAFSGVEECLEISGEGEISLEAVGPRKFLELFPGSFPEIK